MNAARSDRVAVRIAALLCGVVGALMIRALVAGPAGVTSWPAGEVFTAVMLLLAVAARMQRPRISVASLAIGALGGCVLLGAAALLRQPGLHVWAVPAGWQAVVWPLVLVFVSVAEELVFRGVLFDALAEALDARAAAMLAGIVFAAVHVPLYGWRALPLDLAAGLWLGGLRLLSGSVAAPAVAHAVADVGALLIL